MGLGRGGIRAAEDDRLREGGVGDGAIALAAPESIFDAVQDDEVRVLVGPDDATGSKFDGEAVRLDQVEIVGPAAEPVDGLGLGPGDGNRKSFGEGLREVGQAVHGLDCNGANEFKLGPVQGHIIAGIETRTGDDGAKPGRTGTQAPELAAEQVVVVC